MNVYKHGLGDIRLLNDPTVGAEKRKFLYAP